MCKPEFKPGTFEDLKQLYEKAKKNHEDTFYFNGGEFSTAYAKYLIEYTEKETK